MGLPLNKWRGSATQDKFQVTESNVNKHIFRKEHGDIGHTENDPHECATRTVQYNKNSTKRVEYEI